jgi:hypothetical protein
MNSNSVFGTEAGQIGRSSSLKDGAVVRLTVADVQTETIKLLNDCLVSTENMLHKMRGSHPEKGTAGQPDEMPSVLANATKVRQLAYAIQERLDELHSIFGD